MLFDLVARLKLVRVFKRSCLLKHSIGLFVCSVLTQNFSRGDQRHISNKANSSLGTNNITHKVSIYLIALISLISSSFAYAGTTPQTISWVAATEQTKPTKLIDPFY